MRFFRTSRTSKPPLRFHVRLYRANAISIVVFTGVGLFLVAAQIKQPAEMIVIGNAEYVTRNIVKAVQLPLLFNDHEGLQLLLEQTRPLPNIMHLSVLDNEGTPIASAGDKPGIPIDRLNIRHSVRPVELIFDGPEAWHFLGKVVIEDRSVGTVVPGADGPVDAAASVDPHSSVQTDLGYVYAVVSKGSTQDIVNHTLTYGIVAISCALLVILFVVARVTRYVTEPLDQLSRIMDSVAERRTFHRPGRRFETTQETLRISQAFGKMMAELRDRERKLEEHSRSLERTVQERTRELEEARDQALRQSEAKSRFVATLSHELRTPITGIVGIADLLQQTEVTERQRRYLSMLSRSAESLRYEVEQVLDFAKLEKGETLSISSKAFRLMEPIEAVYDMLQPHAVAKNIAFTVERETALPDYVTGDAWRLRQVLQNILFNALKFTVSGTVKLVVRCLTDNEGDHLVEFEVTDTGVGIPETRLPYVLEPFKQGDADVDWRYGGTGLGLSIVRELLEGMGGTYSLISEEGKGTVFTVAIPLTSACEPDSCKVKASFQTTGGLGQRLAGSRVLVAEDSFITRTVLKEILEAHGATVDEAPDGVCALEQLCSHGYDLALLDAQMPHMNGDETIRKYRQSLAAGDREVPIAVLTADVTAEARAAYGDLGIQAFLTKPVDFEVLVEIASECILGCSSPAVE